MEIWQWLAISFNFLSVFMLYIEKKESDKLRDELQYYFRGVTREESIHIQMRLCKIEDDIESLLKERWGAV